MIFGVALEVLRKQSNCWDKITECSANCEECECHVDASDLVEAVKTVLDAFGKCSEIPNSSGDTVSRQAAIDAIINTVSEIGLHDNSEVARYGATFRQHEIIDIIEGMPSAQPERKKNEWIEFDSSEDKYDVIKCPCCKHTFTVDSYHWTDIGFIKDDFKFCPNCGADMRGDADE